jgi:formyltetrahydrofolate deformylase
MHKAQLKINMQKVILVDCSDEKGLVHKITGVFYHNHLNVLSNQEFVQDDGHFFMRTVVEGQVADTRILNGLQGILPADANIAIRKKDKKNVVILVTKEHHALAEILIHHQFNELNVNVLAVIGNHNVLQKFVQQFEIPFYCISHEGKSREAHEQEILTLAQSLNPEYLVLAKYMRILSSDFVKHFPNKIINIHHSFLPAFIGANPYRQAFERGVKIIGATAHFVNDNLDEGPIITQDVLQVNHTLNAKEMAQAGRNVEKLVLAKALRLVFDDAVFVMGNKTIIFES